MIHWPGFFIHSAFKSRLHSFSKEAGSLLILTVPFVPVLVVPADKAAFLLCDVFSQQVVWQTAALTFAVLLYFQWNRNIYTGFPWKFCPQTIKYGSSPFNMFVKLHFLIKKWVSWYTGYPRTINISALKMWADRTESILPCCSLWIQAVGFPVVVWHSWELMVRAHLCAQGCESPPTHLHISRSSYTALCLSLCSWYYINIIVGSMLLLGLESSHDCLFC